MGHDITAYRRADKELETEVAYLRRGAFNPLNRVIYEALNCQEANGGCSGYGVVLEFSRNQLMHALVQVKGGEEVGPEREFLRKCIGAGEDGVRILFG